ncbi:MAG: hypothetical protein DJ555_01185 [Desulfurococcaceae archaeon]|nr:MAG: hypothetical protein DJ555_01185 [Desulfurococcaceae archaeon]
MLLNILFFIFIVRDLKPRGIVFIIKGLGTGLFPKRVNKIHYRSLLNLIVLGSCFLEGSMHKHLTRILERNPGWVR